MTENKLPEIDTEIHSYGKDVIDKYRVCPICTTKLPLSQFNGDIDDWNDRRLAIPCCSCLRLLSLIECEKEEFLDRFKKSAVITKDYEYVIKKTKSNFKNMFYRGFYTKQEFELFIIDLLKYRYLGSRGITPYIESIINNLRIWGIING